MAIEPLFVVDMDALRSRLRLSQAAQTDALSQIDKATEDVRLGFFKALGEVRVLEIVGIPFVENAFSSADLVRTKANNLEVMWVRMFLMRRMPMLFMDSSGETIETWNEEPIQRLQGKTLRDELARMEKEIDEALGDLGGDTGLRGVVTAAVVEPDATDVIKPRYTIQPLLGDF